MKATTILSAVALAGVVALTIVTICVKPGCGKCEQTPSGEAANCEIVFFQLDKVISEYQMAIDLNAAFEKKAASVGEEVNRRGAKIEADIKAWQEKIDKGLLTRSTAEIQGQQLDKKRNEFLQYSQQKEGELAEEQQVILNNIADAVKTFVDSYRIDKGYTMILTTQGNLLPAPVASASAALDITEDLVKALNEAYVPAKK